MTTLILESLPIQGIFSSIPRQYSVPRSALQEVGFNGDPQNCLTVEKIWSGAEYLATTEFQGQPAVRHLVIVAASTPFDDTSGANVTPSSGSTPWLRLAHRLALGNIQCHMVLIPGQNISPFMSLFEETLRLQNLVEETPSFPFDNGQMILRLSARPQIYSAAAVPHTNQASQRALPRRNHSYPLPSRPSVEEEMLCLSSANDAENSPSLVTQIQQVHGLTKKKVYGTKQVRKPFFRDERMRKEPVGVPAPLILPSAHTPPRPNATGRVLSTSKAARISRVAQSSPTELQPRRPVQARRGSRMSSPETESYPSPTTFTVPSNASPVSPSSLMYMQPAPIIPLQPETILDPSWGAMQYNSAMPHSPSYSTASSQSLASPWHEHTADPSRPLQVPMRNTYPLTTHRPLSQDMGSKMYYSGGGNDSPTYHLPRRASCPEDEEPFTFNAEYVAATAALFKSEILPVYPDLRPAFDEVVSPRRAFYIANDHGSMPPSPSSPYDPGELYVAAERDELRHQPPPMSLDYGTSAGSPRLAYATSYSPGSTSSLTGWAG
ncbi:hypothetical protein H0H81_008259 [Sphagnurus paluster]|uniref:Uncharacterized protein n=1 Tax=Sphagnurus paluster TaxID=117069 RepID=A0A9P7GJ12_9AGAR|nr:hypothetical protein H0H81_008259 [Sphagnurus paluster]